jgi:hypothetical protein
MAHKNCAIGRYIGENENIRGAETAIIPSNGNVPFEHWSNGIASHTHIL